jgi:hypothetical protein
MKDDQDLQTKSCNSIARQPHVSSCPNLSELQNADGTALPLADRTNLSAWNSVYKQARKEGPTLRDHTTLKARQDLYKDLARVGCGVEVPRGM